MQDTFKRLDLTALTSVTGGGAGSAFQLVDVGLKLWRDGDEVRQYLGRTFHRWGKHM